MHGCASIAAMQTRPLTYVVDPNDPRAPSQELWDRLGDAERARIIQSLPTGQDLLPSEGTQHFSDKARVFETLSAYMGSAYINDFPNQGRLQRVVVQADAFNPTHASITICPVTSDVVDAPMFRVALPATRDRARR